MKKHVLRSVAAMMILCMAVVTPVQAASKKKVTISMNGASMNAGSSRSLGVKVNTKSSLSYKTSNSKVLTVKNGKLTAKQPGTAKITVTASPKSKNYTKTSKSVSVKVIPAKPGTPTAKRSGKTVNASAKKVKYASGYQFQYASDKKMSGAKSKTVKSPSFSVSASGSKTWYIRVRAYTKVGKTNYYSSWSGIRSVSACKHTWDKGKVTKKATCTAAGTKIYTCTKCKDTKTNSLAKTGHAWDSGVVTKQPGCTQDGIKTYTCTKCKGTKTSPVGKVGHTWDSGKVTKEPTHSEEGEKIYTCTKCHSTKTEPIPKLPECKHTWDSGVITKQPGCTQDGIKTYTCTKCKATKTSPVGKTGHTWDSGKVTKEPTCGDEGERTYTCSKCKEKKTEAIPKTDDHDWRKGGVICLPTGEKEGEMRYYCDRCKITKTEPIPLPVSKYTYSVHILNHYKVQSGCPMVVYIKTDNPDINTFSVKRDNLMTCYGWDFVDVNYLRDDDGGYVLRAVDGGYITVVSSEQIGTNVIEIYERNKEYEEEFGMRYYTYRVASSKPFQVYDSEASYNAFLDEIIDAATKRANNYPDNTKYSLEERILMEACSYVKETCTYPLNTWGIEDEGRYIFLLSNHGVWWDRREVSSATGPTIIMDIGDKLGIEGLTPLTGSMHAYVQWNVNGHEHFLNANNSAYTSAIDPKTIKPFDFSVYK